MDRSILLICLFCSSFSWGAQKVSKPNKGHGHGHLLRRNSSKHLTVMDPQTKQILEEAFDKTCHKFKHGCSQKGVDVEYIHTKLKACLSTYDATKWEGAARCNNKRWNDPYPAGQACDSQMKALFEHFYGTKKFGMVFWTGGISWLAKEMAISLTKQAGYDGYLSLEGSIMGYVGDRLANDNKYGLNTRHCISGVAMNCKELQQCHDYWGMASKYLAEWTDNAKTIISIQRAPRPTSYFWKEHGEIYTLMKELSHGTTAKLLTVWPTESACNSEKENTRIAFGGHSGTTDVECSKTCCDFVNDLHLGNYGTGGGTLEVYCYKTALDAGTVDSTAAKKSQIEKEFRDQNGRGTVGLQYPQSYLQEVNTWAAGHGATAKAEFLHSNQWMPKSTHCETLH